MQIEWFTDAHVDEKISRLLAMPVSFLILLLLHRLFSECNVNFSFFLNAILQSRPGNLTQQSIHADTTLILSTAAEDGTKFPLHGILHGHHTGLPSHRSKRTGELVNFVHLFLAPRHGGAGHNLQTERLQAQRRGSAEGEGSVSILGSSIEAWVAPLTGTTGCIGVAVVGIFSDVTTTGIAPTPFLLLLLFRFRFVRRRSLLLHIIVIITCTAVIITIALIVFLGQLGHAHIDGPVHGEMESQPHALLNQTLGVVVLLYRIGIGRHHRIQRLAQQPAQRLRRHPNRPLVMVGVVCRRRGERRRGCIPALPLGARRRQRRHYGIERAAVGLLLRGKVHVDHVHGVDEGTGRSFYGFERLEQPLRLAGIRGQDAT